jgi:hypothetical protein
MSFRIEVNGQKLNLAFMVRIPEKGSKYPYGVELVKETRKGLEPITFTRIGVGLEEYLQDDPAAYRLQDGEFYLRDYDKPEVVNKLVEEGWIEPVVEANPFKSGYVNFWVYRLTDKAQAHTHKVPT